MTYQNGRIPRSELAPIPGPVPGSVCYLRKDAAAAFNAMNAESERRYGVTLRPLGYMSAYRTYEQQDYLWDHVAHAHDVNWVARPGTSNHGWGIAVDFATKQMRWIVDQIGAKYGWAKKWSDAPVEWWHIRWRPGVWKGRPAPKPNPLRVLTKKEKFLVQRLGYHRAQMTKEARSGKGPKYEQNRKWASYYKQQIRQQMNNILAAHKKNKDWSVLNRGARYQILRKAYNNQL